MLLVLACRPMRRAALLALVAGNVAAKEWSLKEFLVGEWALEKQQPDGNGRIEYAHYSFDAKDNNLVGSYWEEDDDGNKIRCCLWAFTQLVKGLHRFGVWIANQNGIGFKYELLQCCRTRYSQKYRHS